MKWRLSGRSFKTGELIGEMPESIAGAPTIQLVDGSVTARDDAGTVPVVRSREHTDQHGVLRWTTQRATVGDLRVSYVAAPVTAEARPATPPLELRSEASGFSGALKCLVIMPAGPEDLSFELSWVPPARPDRQWRFVTSLGEGEALGPPITGTGLELLGDTYVMCGDLDGHHFREGDLSIWWLTTPGFDVRALTSRLGATYRAMTEVFGVERRPYRVFLRSLPHRGANSSAHPASFVTAMNPAAPLSPALMYETLAHELVHEWLQLDGAPEEIAWFVEGSADYYSLVVPYRAGLLDQKAFVQAVNLEARNGFANVHRSLTLDEATKRFFTDFSAHWLPYARGMFYLADLDARLRRGAEAGCLDDLVREVISRRRAGRRVGLVEWCDLVTTSLGDDERAVVDDMVFTGVGRPSDGCFGAEFEKYELEVPVLDLGFDIVTLVSRRVTNLVPGGLADRAGLREGEPIDLPGYTEILSLDRVDDLVITVTRDGATRSVSLPLSESTVAVPQWRVKEAGEVTPEGSAAAGRLT